MTSVPEESGEELSHAKILKFYSPLALSWIFMAMESPVALSVISRMPNAEINTAAFQPLMALALLIESPVIDLLTTSTTLGKDRKHYIQISRFVWSIMVFVTAVHALFTLTPLYTWVTESAIGLKPEVAQIARPALILMIPWSALIGWRRYLQGLLIRHGRTKLIGYGTAVRMTTMATGSFTLYALGILPSLLSVSLALVASVAAEATYIHFASRFTIKSHLAQDDPELGGIDQRFLARFHLPLTATTIITILSQPLVSTALARSPDPLIALGAFQVASSIIWLHRTIVFALPEVVITLYRKGQYDEKLKRFCLLIGLFTTGTMFLSAITNLDSWIFERLLGVTQPSTLQAAHLCLQLSCLLPLIGAYQSYLRGVLAAHHLTVSRLTAIMAALICLLGCLGLGVWRQWLGVVTASLALTLAQVAEFGVLAFSWRRGQTRLENAQVTQA